ncbi:hypothetical protein RQP46_009068 [Phenoliferia psychrophenolica]
MASSIPSSGGVYHYATVTAGPEWGLVAGYASGMLSWGGWIIVQLWAIYHPEYVSEAWHVYVCYLVLVWSTACICIFANRLIPTLQNVCLVLVIGGLFVTVAVLAALPKKHATSSITHMAEELPNPRRQLPIGIAAQILLGAFTSFTFAVALMYSIQDLDALLASTANFPLATVYIQATNGNTAATTGLLCIVLFAIYITLIGCHCGRSWFALSRDGATPFADVFGRASARYSCPIPATIFCAFVMTCLGAIQLGSKTAFTDLVGAFILLTTVSYAIPTFAHVVSGRNSLPMGYFWMGQLPGYFVNIASLVLTAFFFVM